MRSFAKGDCRHPWLNHPNTGRLWPFAKRVDCTIATNNEQPEYRVRVMIFSRPFLCIHCICARSSAGSQVLCKLGTRAARLVTVLTENPPARRTEFSLETEGTDWQLELAVACVMIARLESERGRHRAAIPSYEEASRILSTLLKSTAGFAQWATAKETVDSELRLVRTKAQVE